MYQRGKKRLSMLLALCMVFGFMPLTAQAALLNGEDYITQQLYLGEDLVLHLRGDIPEAYQSATAVITFCGESKSCAISDLTQDENGLYDMAVEVDVAEMTENIGLKATYMGLTAIEENYSVAEYLKTLIGGNYTNQTKALALELLNFGAAAQNYFDYKTDNLATAGGYEYPPANAVPDDAPAVVLRGKVDGVCFYGASVRHLSKTAVRFYFHTDSVDGLTFTVDGQEYTPGSNDNGYYIEVGGINPQDMDNEITVEVTDGTDTMSVQYTPISYFIRTYHNSENEELKALAASAYSYFVAANNFVGVEPTGDFTEGVYFDAPGNVQLFSGVGGDNAWRDALLEIVSFEDNNVLKLTCASSQWPVFRINFGTTFKAGTMIDFRAYITDVTGADKSGSVSLFEGMPGESYLVYSQGSDATAQYDYNNWTDLTIVLAEDREYVDLVCNMDRTNDSITSANIEVYMDAFKAYEPVEISGDILEGLDFEDAGNALWFGSLEGDNAWRNATLRRAFFDGDYALKITCANSQWPVFRINFGKTLKAGTSINFQAFSWDTTNAEKNTVSIFENIPGESYLVQTSSNGATDQYYYNSWADLTMVLTEDRDYVDLVCNMDRWNENGPANLEVYLDNFKAVEPFDITQGFDFEAIGDENAFSGIGENNAAAVERVSYADAGVTAPANGGSYALQVSHASDCWPNFRVNFGKTLKAGTTITFDVYGNYDYAAAEGVNKYVKLELTGDSKNFATSADPNQVVWTLVETWNTVTVTLTADSDHVDFFYNVADGQHGNVSSWLLLDNFMAEEKLVFNGDFETGVGLEDAGDILQFTGITQDINVDRVAYADTGVSAPANGGSYALKVSHASDCWPNFRVNFGKTLKAGTTITFDVYGNYDYAAAEGVNKYVKLELTGDSKNFATSADPNQVVWTLVETWKTGVTITLTADSDHVDFFYNVADGQHGDVSSWILMDNFKAVEPILISEGFNFDNADEAGAFEALTEGVTFETTSVDGNNVLKASHASECWPNFRVNFGETLKAGTAITFDVYGNYDYAAAEGVNKYVKLELTGDSKNYATSADPNQVVWTLVETWKTGVTITLTADSDHVDFFYNVADGQHGDVSSWILMDNFKAVEPILISEGFNFDNADEAGAFEALTEGVTFETTSVDGNNVLKASHASECWPNFRVNFGETLKAGTAITFDVYGNYDYAAAEGVNKYVKLELTGNSKNFATSADPNQVVWTLVETWNTVTVTLTADSDYVDFFYNVADGQHGNVASWILMDNFKAEAPVLISDGLTFDDSRDAELFTGIEGQEWRNAAAEVVTVEGNNVLKLSCSSSAWPTFRLNFGETLKAGTTITFDFYGNYDYVVPEGGYKYVKLELTDNSKNFATSEDPNQVVWTLAETWNTVTLIVTADCSYIEFYYNVADGQHGDAPASWIYLDNFSVA